MKYILAGIILYHLTRAVIDWYWHRWGKVQCNCGKEQNECDNVDG
jgi:hypothetical protein